MGEVLRTAQVRAKRMDYHKPVLTEYGSIHRLTRSTHMGPCMFDSGKSKVVFKTC